MMTTLQTLEQIAISNKATHIWIDYSNEEYMYEEDNCVFINDIDNFLMDWNHEHYDSIDTVEQFNENNEDYYYIHTIAPEIVANYEPEEEWTGWELSQPVSPDLEPYILTLGKLYCEAINSGKKDLAENLWALKRSLMT